MINLSKPIQKLKSNIKIITILAILFVLSTPQTADDDEVDTSIPNYPFKIYSGTSHKYSLQATSSSTFSKMQKQSTTYSSLPSMTKPTTH